MEYNRNMKMDNFQKSEVSSMKWMDMNQCLQHIRTYNLEKKRLITKIDSCLSKYAVYGHYL